MEILLTHFQKNCDSSRVIVFFEYRDSVMEAFALLCQYHSIIKPRIFLGQKNGITQKSQINVSIYVILALIILNQLYSTNIEIFVLGWTKLTKLLFIYS